MTAADDILLTAEELELRRGKRRRWLAISVFLLFVAVATFFGARPAGHQIKAWQARRHAQRAFAYIQTEQWNDAQREASAAYQLCPSEPQALRAVARFLSRVRQPEALDFWKQLQEEQSLTREDRRDQVVIALAANDLSVAGVALNDLLNRKDSAVSAADWLLAARVAQQKGEINEARKFGQKVLNDSSADDQTQFQAALLLHTLDAPESRDVEPVDAGWARLKKLAEGKTNTALAALVVLAQHALSDTPSSINHQPLTISNLIRALETHPLAKTPHKLIALDLQMHGDPTRSEALILQAIADWKDADTPSLVALATWLSGKGEFKREIDSIPLERVFQSRDLFLLHLDALGALGRWSEIAQLLESEHFPLDEVAQFMYLARCNERLGEKTAAENNWNRALEAAGGDPGKLMTLADYAESDGANEVAEIGYNDAASVSPKLRDAWQGRLRLAQRSSDAKKIHAVLAEMLTIWPNDGAIQSDEAYARLLLLFSNSWNDENRMTKDKTLKKIEQLAEKLVERNPHSLPHRTLLALARLQQNRAEEALDVYANIQVQPNALTPSALAVHAAVLAANGRAEGAKAEAAQINVDSLLPEEKTLIQNLL